jgi:sugar transferase (PEP-CTERM system associated)
MLKVFQHHIPLSALAELLADALFCFVAVLLAAQGLQATRVDAATDAVPLAHLLLPAAGFALLMSLLYSLFGLYRASAAAIGVGALIGRAILAILVGVAIVYFAFNTESLGGRAWAMVFHTLLYMVLGLVAVRLLFHVIPRAVVRAPRVLIVGVGAEALGVASDLRLPGRSRRTVVGYYPAGTDQGARIDARLFPRDVPLDALVRQHQIDEVIVAVREQRGGGVPMDQLLACRLQGTPVLDLAGFYERTRGQVPTESLKASWLVYGHGFVQGPVRTAVKRSFDVVCSLLLLAIASPVMLLTALLVKLDSPGPIIYRQERVGLGGRSFMCLKFRSMCSDAERDGVARWASKNDARVTRVGAFIRKCRIDELPQLLSVLKGEMSLVGPRPERPSFVAQLREQIPFYDIRHSVKPGVTGWAQVRYSYGASVEDARRKHEYDLYYVKNNSLFLDLLVLVETVSVVLFREGAQ